MVIGTQWAVGHVLVKMVGSDNSHSMLQKDVVGSAGQDEHVDAS